jgi:uncharacterized membrane protein
MFAVLPAVLAPAVVSCAEWLSICGRDAQFRTAVMTSWLAGTGLGDRRELLWLCAAVV